ncbi:MAG: endonuclease/exonuclease/phosphatase family protein [Octadecabacter sp.]|nr:endonuclease/exonuclease/phosphatase family protein [Octadecabacter sp.]
MKIVSLNAWGGQVWPALGSWLGSYGADVVCLQEMIKPVDPSPPWLAYRDAFRSLNQRSDLFGDICKSLPHHNAAFHPAVQGKLSDTAGVEYVSQHGLGQWCAPGLTVLDRIDGFVHGAFRKDGWGDEPVPRGFQAVRLAQQGRARSVTIAHFHGLRDAAGKGDTPLRQEQAKRAITLLSQIASPKDDVVLAGDFNILPTSETFDIFADWGLRDLVGTQDTRTQLYRKDVRHANYMLVSASVKVQAFEVLAAPVVSDHCPLVVSLG